MSWFKIDDNFHGHPKVKSIPRKDRAAAIGLWCMAGSWSSHQLTDGHVPAYMVEEFGGTARLAGLLVTARLWLTDDVRGGWVFHDWHVRQPSRAEVEEKRRKSAERLKAWRAGKRAASNAGETALHDGSYTASPELRNDSETLTPTRPDPTRPDPTVLPTEEHKDSSSEPEGSDADEPYREDVEKVCQHLRDRIVSNGSKEPTIGKGWRKSARLLIDRDGRTVPQIIAAIDWCQNDEFWRSNILSMPKLREKYETLRLQAQKTKQPAQRERLTIGGGDSPSWEM